MIGPRLAPPLGSVEPTDQAAEDFHRPRLWNAPDNRGQEEVRR
jgi:hypothetical protein